MSLILDIYKNQTIDEVQYNFKKLCCKVMECIDMERQDMTAVLVNKGYEYMKSNIPILSCLLGQLVNIFILVRIILASYLKEY